MLNQRNKKLIFVCIISVLSVVFSCTSIILFKKYNNNNNNNNNNNSALDSTKEKNIIDVETFDAGFITNVTTVTGHRSHGMIIETSEGFIFVTRYVDFSFEKGTPVILQVMHNSQFDLLWVGDTKYNFDISIFKVAGFSNKN